MKTDKNAVPEPGVVDVAVCPDERAAMPASVTLASAASTLAPKWRLRAWLVDCGLYSWQRTRMLSLADRHGFELHIIPCDEGLLKGLPICRHFSRAMYGRVLLPRLLAELDRVIYLDSDTVVAANLADLWSIQLGDALLAACPNWPEGRPMSDTKAMAYATQELSSPNDAYFNSGVLLMDLRKCRHTNIEGVVREFLIRHQEETLAPDQDALNYAASGRYLILDGQWNIQCNAQAPSATFDQGIFHLVGPYKPWCGGPRNAYIRAYIAEMTKSKWLYWWEWPAYLLGALTPPRLRRMLE